MIICITGCGPNLSKDHVPKNSFIIGVNRSYEYIEPHIIATIDPLAYNHIRKIANRKEPIYMQRYLRVPEEIRELNNSGTFAIWIATFFNPIEIHLTGFGGIGHFYPEKRGRRASNDEDAYREKLIRVEKYNKKVLQKAINYINAWGIRIIQYGN